MFQIFSFLMAACLMTSAFSSMAGVIPINEESGERPRRFIFLVHGLHGTGATFGALPRVLTTHGTDVQPSTDIRVIPFSYATGSSENTYKFADDLAKGMLEKIQGLRPTDRITLVAHSQGGLISWIWYILSLNKEPGFAQYHQLAQQTEGLMTLGSPIWGSKLASFLEKYPSLKSKAKEQGLGEHELGEMAYGSDTIYRFRQRAIRLDQTRSTVPLRMLAVGGVLNPQTDTNVPVQRRFLLGLAETALGSGGNFQAESDIAVSLPSARFDFIYLKQGKNHLTDIKAEDFMNFHFPQAGNMKVVRAPHASWSQKKFYDMAEVPTSCVDLQKPCTHPTYPLILSFTMACTSEIANCRADVLDQYVQKFTSTDLWKTKISPPNLEVNRLHSFMLDIVLDMPENYRLPNDEDIRDYVQFAEDGGKIFNGTDKSYFFRVNRLLEFQSSSARAVEYKSNPAASVGQKQIRLTLHGHAYQNFPETGGDLNIYAAKAKAGFKLPMVVNLPGYAPRKVEVLVKPTYTTFINLDYKN